MYKNYRIGAILLMAGSGNRFGSEVPKQFHLVGHRRVYLHALDVVQSAQIFDEILLVTHPEWVDIVANEAPVGKVIQGAKTRQESSYNGLKGFSQKPDIVLIHDAVRPFVSKEILISNVENAITHQAVDTCIPSADTLVYAPDVVRIDKIPKRAHYLRGQTPQTFHYEKILRAHQETKLENATDDCVLILEQGSPVFIVYGDERNFKITNQLDIKLAELLINNN
jgi:2-C-methyl-D-erythritol 4-phosphate cytidylyltransferase